MKPRLEGLAIPARAGGLTRIVLVSTVVLLLVLGFVPDFVVRMARAGRPQLATSTADQLYRPMALPSR